MTTPKVATLHRGGSRWYIHPETGDKVPGVTSILNMLPKPFLKAWASKEVATCAVEQRGAWLPMAETDPAGAIDYLKRAPQRSTQGAADLGSAAHGIFEAMARGERLGPLTDDLAVFAGHYADFLDTVQPEFRAVEETVWSEAHAYAGSFDAFAVIDGEGCWIDNKTTRSGVYPEVALQLSAYAHADYLLGDDGGRGVMPRGSRGVVVHVRPEGWALYEVPIGDEVFAHFLSLRQTFLWDAQSRGIIGKPLLKGAAK